MMVHQGKRAGSMIALFGIATAVIIAINLSTQTTSASARPAQDEPAYPQGTPLALREATFTPTITPTRTNLGDCNFFVGARDVTALIGAVIVADADSTPDTICLVASTYTFTQAYTPANALPAITTPITIQGNGAILIRASTADFRFFSVLTSGTLTLKNLTLAEGQAFQGGAIRSHGTLTLDDVRLFNNLADGGAGGGIYAVNGVLTIRNSILSGNESRFHPSGGEDSGFGGALYLGSNRVLIDSTIIGGDAPNRAYYASGIYIARENTEVTVLHSQITNNASRGIVSLNSPDAARVVIRQSCFSGNGQYAIFNPQDARTIDAAWNWWGAADGPANPLGSGSGDRVSSKIDFTNFLTSAPLGCGMQPSPTPTLVSLTPPPTLTHTPPPTWTPSPVPTQPTVTPHPSFSPMPCTYWAWTVSDLVGAIQASNAAPDADLICLGNSNYILTSGPFASGTATGYNGLPPITSPITIRGGGATIRRESAAQFRIFYVAPTGSLTLNSVTVMGGGFDLYHGPAHGGGILAWGSLTLEGCRILDNTASAGGGVYALEPLTIHNSVFGNNTATAGSAIYVEDDLILQSSTLGGSLPNTALGAGTIFMGNFTDVGAVAILRDSWITNNYAGNEGGAIYAVDAFAPIQIDNTHITGNYAQTGGGIAAEGWTQFILSNGTVIGDNVAQYDGGGIHYKAASPPDYIPGGITLQTGARITHNTALNGYGGGIYILGTELDDISAFEFTGAQIDSNNAGMAGGGIYIAYGVLTLDQVILANNTAPNYGAIYDDSEGMPPSSMHQSCITGNSPISLIHTYEPALDASNNWWGAADGPSGAGPGSGDSISGNVLYEPFLTTPPAQCAVPLPTFTPTFTPLPTATPRPTATRTSTPVLTCGNYLFEFQSFEQNGVVHFRATNNASSAVPITGFRIAWAHTPSAGPLASVSVGGANAFDPAGVVIWQDADTTSPSVGSSSGGEPTWLATAAIPAGQTREVWFNFDGTTGSLLDLGYSPISFNGSTLTLGGACEIAAGALVPTNTPAPSATPTPAPSSTPTNSPCIPAGDTATLITVIQFANSTAAPDTICLENGLYAFTTGLPSDPGPNALPSIRYPLTIRGNGATLQRQGEVEFRFLYVEATGSLTLDHITLQDGVAGLDDSNAKGGAVLSYGPLTVTNSVFSGNIAAMGGSGGAIYIEQADLIVRNSTFTGNIVTFGPGGAISSPLGGTVLIEDSVIGGTPQNWADYGSGIYVCGCGSETHLTVRRSQITNNHAVSSGGGVLVEGHGSAVFEDSLIDTNRGPWGGGIGAVTDTNKPGPLALIIDHTIVQGNLGGQAGGVYVRGETSLTVQNGSQIIFNKGGDGGGIYAGPASTVTIQTGSQISYNSGSSLGAIFMAGTGTMAISNSRLEGNQGSLYSTRDSEKVITVQSSCLSNNGSGWRNESTSLTAQAANNWWGAADGPSGAGPGSGDPVSTKITFAPFLTAALPGCGEPPNPTLTPTTTLTYTPSPTRTPTPTITYTPSPTRTVDPAYLSSSGCVPLGDPAGTILCTQ